MTATPLHLDGDPSADPHAYLASLCSVTLDIVRELAEAIAADDTRVMRAACLRLTSVGALAGIAGGKL